MAKRTKGIGLVSGESGASAAERLARSCPQETTFWRKVLGHIHSFAPHYRMKLAPHQLVQAFPEFQKSLHRLFCTRRTFHKLSRVPRRVLINQNMASRNVGEGYEKWTQQQLIARIQELEAKLTQNPTTTTAESVFPSSTELATELATSPTVTPQPIPYRKPPKQPPKAFDASKYSTRLIALKFAYLGQGYNGFEHHQNNKTPLPTIEEELWKALVKTRLINPTPTKENGTPEDGQVKYGGKGNGAYDRIGKSTFEKWDREGADVNWEGCEYSKCGRTDRGVSAFGQVIGVRVRSNRPLPKASSRPASPAHNPETELSTTSTGQGEELPISLDGDIEPEAQEKEKSFDGLHDELPYIQLLNRVLPPSIRIYAWCPNPPPNFSARFSCKERRYRYFFTNPCFAPVPGSAGLYSPATSSTSQREEHMREGRLDIDAMRKGCRELIGLHDFRNMCKIDASKQLTNFKRRIFHADIEEISPLSLPSFLSHPSLSSPSSTATTASSSSVAGPKMYSFTLHGSAFLWHQVRSIIALLFLIGQGLEAPSLITNLLDIESNPTRPKYEMASDAPLVLWDCIFPYEDEVQSSEEREHGYEDRLEWVYVGDPGAIEPKSSKSANIGRGKWGRGGVIDDVWEVWRGHKMEETLSSLLLDVIAKQGKSTLDSEQQIEAAGEGSAKQGPGPRVFDGADVGRAKGKYIPVLNRERQDTVEVVNERYAKRKGLKMEERRAKDDEGDE